MTREVITRRNLPHWYVPGAAHFVTFRLAGTLPRDVVERLQQRKEQLLKAKRPMAIARCRASCIASKATPPTKRIESCGGPGSSGNTNHTIIGCAMKTS